MPRAGCGTRCSSGPRLAQVQAMPIAYLPDRGVVEVTGEDRTAFLQGLVTNDVAGGRPRQARLRRAAHAAGQVAGRFLHPRRRRPAAAGLRGGAGGDAGAEAVPLPAALEGGACAMPRPNSPCMPAGAARRSRPAPSPRPTRGCRRPAGAPCRRAPLADRCHARRTGTATAWRSACRRARATWSPSRPCCSRPATTSCTASPGPRAATWARS